MCPPTRCFSTSARCSENSIARLLNTKCTKWRCATIRANRSLTRLSPHRRSAIHVRARRNGCLSLFCPPLTLSSQTWRCAACRSQPRTTQHAVRSLCFHCFHILVPLTSPPFSGGLRPRDCRSARAHFAKHRRGHGHQGRHPLGQRHGGRVDGRALPLPAVWRCAAKTRACNALTQQQRRYREHREPKCVAAFDVSCIVLNT